ncbi:unnamed protein product, partial [Linum tenue]
PHLSDSASLLCILLIEFSLEIILDPIPQFLSPALHFPLPPHPPWNDKAPALKLRLLHAWITGDTLCQDGFSEFAILWTNELGLASRHALYGRSNYSTVLRRRDVFSGACVGGECWRKAAVAGKVEADAEEEDAGDVDTLAMMATFDWKKSCPQLTSFDCPPRNRHAERVNEIDSLDESEICRGTMAGEEGPYLRGRGGLTRAGEDAGTMFCLHG